MSRKKAAADISVNNEMAVFALTPKTERGREFLGRLLSRAEPWGDGWAVSQNQLYNVRRAAEQEGLVIVHEHSRRKP